MVKTINSWIGAMRLRTLPLSLSGIIVGSALAYFYGVWDTPVFSMAISTTILFQVLSNLANDLGDSQKGTDNDQRLGPNRAVQSGTISLSQMKIAVAVVSLLSLLSASFLVFLSSEFLSPKAIWVYFGLAIISIVAAITYTVGKSAYGYFGLGDLMVFLFFGILSVIGVFGLYGESFKEILVFPAFTIGLWSAAVLNLNNMRDIDNDRDSKKRTLVVFMGATNARYYHSFLILFGFFSWFFFIVKLFISAQNGFVFLALIPSFWIFIHLRGVFLIQNPKHFDNELKKVALVTFFSSLTIALTLFLM
tara:strand:+ start:117 stop:1034 length:918 start_codon:yes stop_codon:yes gene_type:complete